MNFDAEQRYKAALIEEAFELHDVVLPNPIEVYTDDRTTHYRNKVEFSWYGDEQNVDARFLILEDGSKRVARGGAAPIETAALAADEVGADRATGPVSSDLRANSKGIRDDGSGNSMDTLDLAFFRRGGKGKIVVDQCSLLPPEMMTLAREMRDLLHAKGVSARSLKTLLIRCNQSKLCVWQLYIKDDISDIITTEEAAKLPALGGEVIYSDPKSPASRITKRLASFGDIVLTDTILDVPFRYATEGFFQVNIPVYEQALRDMKQWVQDDKPTIDMYSGVGSIGLTIGGDNVTLVEVNEHAVREMERNIAKLGRVNSARPILAASESALDHITGDALVILDPPRAGLHRQVVDRLLETSPSRIIYLSCNPVTQARDVALLLEKYQIVHHQGYNFFPRTPHIEHLVVLDAH